MHWLVNHFCDGKHLDRTSPETGKQVLWNNFILLLGPPSSPNTTSIPHCRLHNKICCSWAKFLATTRMLDISSLRKQTKKYSSLQSCNSEQSLEWPNVGGNLNIGDFEFVQLKAVIECVKPKVEKITETSLLLQRYRKK